MSPPPLVTGIAPKEGLPGTKVIYYIFEINYICQINNNNEILII